MLFSSCCMQACSEQFWTNVCKGKSSMNISTSNLHISHSQFTSVPFYFTSSAFYGWIVQKKLTTSIKPVMECYGVPHVPFLVESTFHQSYIPCKHITSVHSCIKSLAHFLELKKSSTHVKSKHNHCRNAPKRRIDLIYLFSQHVISLWSYF